MFLNCHKNETPPFSELPIVVVAEGLLNTRSGFALFFVFPESSGY